MNKNEAHEIILKQLCKEVEQIAEQMQKKQAISTQEVEQLDKIYHLKKSMLTCKAMEDAEEDYGEDGWSSDAVMGGGNSGRRGRSPVTGRYVSRDTGMRQSYTDGYSEGYSEAMNQMGYNNGGGNSGHYPMMPYPPRRW